MIQIGLQNPFLKFYKYKYKYKYKYEHILELEELWGSPRGRQVLKSDRIDDSWFRLTSQIWLQGHFPICSVADIIWDVEVLNMWKKIDRQEREACKVCIQEKNQLQKAVIPFINQKRHSKQKLHILTTATMHRLILRDENLGYIAHSTNIVCKQNLNKQCKNCDCTLTLIRHRKVVLTV